MKLKLAEYNIGQKLKSERPEMIPQGHLIHCDGFAMKTDPRGFVYSSTDYSKECEICLEAKKIGKFERFLELGNGFGYFGESIGIFEKPHNISFKGNGNAGWQAPRLQIFNKDEKDPLRRFNGLFDGRTYGEGRFVLIRGFEYIRGLADDEFSSDELKERGLYGEFFWQDEIFGRYFLNREQEEMEDIDILSVLKCAGNYYGSYPDAFEFPKLRNYCESGALSILNDKFPSPLELLGNIHENPELYEKLK